MNQIEIDDIKLWIGELVIENRLLQKKITQIEAELLKLKSDMESSTFSMPSREWDPEKGTFTPHTPSLPDEPASRMSQSEN
jgi:hypothetical protein